MRSRLSKVIFRFSYFFVGTMLHRMLSALSRHSREFSTGLFGFTGINVPFDCVIFAEVLLLFIDYGVDKQKEYRTSKEGIGT